MSLAVSFIFCPTFFFLFLGDIAEIAALFPLLFKGL